MSIIVKLALTLMQKVYILNTHTIEELKGNFLFFLSNSKCKCKLFMKVSEICAEQQRAFPASVVVRVSFIHNVFML
jgi:hypothetical protein